MSEINIVGVTPVVAKLKPLSVTYEPEVVPAFAALMVDTTGASYENPLNAAPPRAFVPVIVEMVSTSILLVPPPPFGRPHFIAVAEVHWLLVHKDAPTRVDGVRS